MAGSLADYLARFETLGKEVAYVEHRGYRWVRWTYHDVAGAAYWFAEQLAARGVAKGDRVLLWGPNSAAWVAAFFACAYRGVVAVPMDEAASSDFALRVLHQVQAKLLVGSREHFSPEVPTVLLEDF
jgi:long-chain acyl-CoA synthetase